MNLVSLSVVQILENNPNLQWRQALKQDDMSLDAKAARAAKLAARESGKKFSGIKETTNPKISKSI